MPEKLALGLDQFVGSGSAALARREEPSGLLQWVDRRPSAFPAGLLRSGQAAYGHPLPPSARANISDGWVEDRSLSRCGSFEAASGSGRLVRAAGPDGDIPLEIRLYRPRARQSLAAERLCSLVGGQDRDGRVEVVGEASSVLG